MADQIGFSLPKNVIQEQSQLVVGASFRTRATAAASTPTTVHYRLDCLSTGNQVADLTEVSPSASSVSITITPTQNAIQDECNSYERKQLTVVADYGLATQYVDRITYDVNNLSGLS